MTANIKKSVRYQLNDLVRAVIIYYIIIVAVQILNLTVSYLINSSSAHILVVGNNTTVDISTTVFLFVVGLISFKENFGMLIQNGFSRRAVLTGRLAAFGLAACAMTVIDRLLTLVCNAAGQATNTFASFTTFETVYGPGGFGWQLLGLLFTFAMYCALLMIGYCISLMFYRLNKLGKVLVGAGVPVLLLVVGPALDLNLTGGKVYTAIGHFFAVIFGFAENQPWYAVASFAAITALATLFSWLLLRRATVRK
ncbi:hypothetical protein LJC64_05005 [Ruminococcaceae bacterium OttesenSCG-928-A11]|nr:hypothetical protein [Ruminococcaceae bacterium OttesenSCG-928-A11]